MKPLHIYWHIYLAGNWKEVATGKKLSKNKFKEMKEYANKKV